MSQRALFISNDEDSGHAFGQACRRLGLETPGWCAVRSGYVPHLAQAADVFVIAGPTQEFEGREVARSLLATAATASVICVGTPADMPDGRLQAIAPGEDWPAGAADALVDRLGLTPALLLSYENRLRVLGRELDLRGYKSVNIEEMSGGFLTQPESDGELQPPPISIDNRELRRLAREALTARGEPGWERPHGRLATAGQERLLRYLGSELDRRGATRVQIVALAHSLIVSGYESSSPYARPHPFQEMYRATELRALQQQAGLQRQAKDGWVRRLARRLGMS